jgi:hypothetical protein
MRSRIHAIAAVIALAFGLSAGVATPGHAQASGDCASIQMTVTAALSTEPAYAGLYKYTVTGSWDVTRLGLSHLDIFVALQQCACKCDARIFKFAVPAGTSSGMGSSGLCTVLYDGSYVCKGDPSIPPELSAPTVKFDTVDNGCAALTVGSGTWVFYSPFPPAPSSTYPDAVAIKHGNGTCTGDLAGQLPMCDCSVPVRPATWGGVKATYR